MADVVFLAVLVAFFALATAFVRLCDWLIGPPERVVDDSADAEPVEAVTP